MKLQIEDKNRSDDFEQAKRYKIEGESELQTSCITCKFKPNYLDAVSSFIQAADKFHALGNYEEEIFCREKLVICHRNLKSEWEEGNEYNKIANIYFLNMKDYSKAVQNAQNAYNSFFTKAEYQNAISCLNKLSEKLINIGEDAYADKCLKIAFECVLMVFHTLASKNDEPIEFMYDAVNNYFSLNFKFDKINSILEYSDQFIKVIEPFENDKSRIAEIYGYNLIALCILDMKDKFELVANRAKEIFDFRDAQIIYNIEKMYDSIIKLNEREFKDSVRSYSYGNDVIKYLHNYYNIKKEKNHNIEQNDINIELDHKNDNIDDFL